MPIPEPADGRGARAAVPRPRVAPPHARAGVRAPDGPVEDVDERAEPLREAALRRRAPGRLRALLRPNPPPTADR
ncbi:MAG TPA: hypothetical protein VFV01_03705, partial [Spirillospora sp.]|nr:hypothetical protein [Spirillospora sp.]